VSLEIDPRQIPDRLMKPAMDAGQPVSPSLLPQQRCPATMRHNSPYSSDAYGVQCKYTVGHEGDHAGYAGFGQGDVFWSTATVTKRQTEG
jgi:hypothetical protein